MPAPSLIDVPLTESSTDESQDSNVVIGNEIEQAPIELQGNYDQATIDLSGNDLPPTPVVNPPGNDSNVISLNPNAPPPAKEVSMNAPTERGMDAVDVPDRAVNEAPAEDSKDEPLPELPPPVQNATPMMNQRSPEVAPDEGSSTALLVGGLLIGGGLLAWWAMSSKK